MPPEALPGTIDIGQFIQEVKETLLFLISPQFQEKLLSLKIIAIVISVLFILAILYFLSKSSYLKDALLDDLEDLSAFREFGQKKIVKRWNKIKKRLERGSGAQQKLSLIEALQMFDEILVRAGYGGESLDERLKKLTEKDMTNLESVLAALQICQDIARDPDYRLSRERAEEILNIFEKAFTDLQVF